MDRNHHKKRNRDIDRITPACDNYGGRRSANHTRNKRDRNSQVEPYRDYAKEREIEMALQLQRQRLNVSFPSNAAPVVGSDDTTRQKDHTSNARMGSSSASNATTCSSSFTVLQSNRSSSVVPAIPGFYYDPEKNKYFRHTKQSLKTHKDTERNSVKSKVAKISATSRPITSSFFKRTDHLAEILRYREYRSSSSNISRGYELLQAKSLHINERNLPENRQSLSRSLIACNSEYVAVANVGFDTIYLSKRSERSVWQPVGSFSFDNAILVSLDLRPVTHCTGYSLLYYRGNESVAMVYTGEVEGYCTYIRFRNADAYHNSWSISGESVTICNEIGIKKYLLDAGSVVTTLSMNSSFQSSAPPQRKFPTDDTTVPVYYAQSHDCNSTGYIGMRSGEVLIQDERVSCDRSSTSTIGNLPYRVNMLTAIDHSRKVIAEDCVGNLNMYDVRKPLAVLKRIKTGVNDSIVYGKFHVTPDEKLLITTPKVYPSSAWKGNVLKGKGCVAIYSLTDRLGDAAPTEALHHSYYDKGDLNVSGRRIVLFASNHNHRYEDYDRQMMDFNGIAKNYTDHQDLSIVTGDFRSSPSNDV